MTVGEIIFAIECYNERTREEYKKDLALNYALAQNIAVAVSANLSGQKAPSLYETYPDLFREEQPLQEDKTWMLYKEQFIDFAQAHNKKRGEKAQ